MLKIITQLFFETLWFLTGFYTSQFTIRLYENDDNATADTLPRTSKSKRSHPAGW